MKQSITVEQFKELSPSAQEKAKSIIEKSLGSLLFVELSFQEVELKKYNGIYTGVVTKTRDKAYSATYDTGKTSAPFKLVIQEKDYPLFSIGEMLQIIEEHGNAVPHMIVDVDHLWKQVKKILENENKSH